MRPSVCMRRHAGRLVCVLCSASACAGPACATCCMLSMPMSARLRCGSAAPGATPMTASTAAARSCGRGRPVTYDHKAHMSTTLLLADAVRACEAGAYALATFPGMRFTACPGARPRAWPGRSTRAPRTRSRGAAPRRPPYRPGSAAWHSSTGGAARPAAMAAPSTRSSSSTASGGRPRKMRPTSLPCAHFYLMAPDMAPGSTTKHKWYQAFQCETVSRWDLGSAGNSFPCVVKECIFFRLER